MHILGLDTDMPTVYLHFLETPASEHYVILDHALLSLLLHQLSFFFGVSITVDSRTTLRFIVLRAD